MKQKIQDESPERMLELIRMGHPDECGEPYSRHEVIQEFGRRGKEIFEALGWPTEDDAIYKNRYTGSEQTLIDTIFEDGGKFRKTKLNWWSAMGDWWPVDMWIPDDLLGCYKANPKLSSFFPELE